MKEQTKGNWITIRGLDKKLYKEARAEAIKQNLNIGDWLNQAMREKLARDTAKTKK